MTPSAALHSNVYLTYLAIAVGLLATGGAVIGALGLGLKRDVGHAWSAYRGWLVMVPLILFVVFLGRAAVITTLTVVAVLAFREFGRATGLDRDRWMTPVIYLGPVAVGLICLVPDPKLHVPGWYGLFAVLPTYVFAGILLIPIFRNRAESQLQAVTLSAFGFLYIGWMFGHLIFLANVTLAYGYVLYLLFAVELNDVAAFTFGKMFGRRPLRSKISPGKTWEGALGALTVSLALPWVLGFSFPHFTSWQRVLTGLIVGIGGQLGDLSISVIKRDLGIKDMGSAIVGHGGILDRIDSMIYVAPLFFHMVRWYHDIY